MDPLVPLIRALGESEVRFVVIGVAGVNYFAEGGSTIFPTRDRDLFLPPDPANLVRCWQACTASGLELYADREPLDQPRDSWLAERVIERRALTRATDGVELEIDLTVVMKGFDFETVWNARRTFLVEGLQVPVARLLHIVMSKRAAARDKDVVFLAAHREALATLLRREEER